MRESNTPTPKNSTNNINPGTNTINFSTPYCAIIKNLPTFRAKFEAISSQPATIILFTISMRKQFSYAALGLALLTGLLLFFRSQRIVKDEAYYSVISQYIYAYSGGSVGAKDAIRVRFVNAAVDAAQIGKPVAAGVFTINPKVAGQAVWKDDRSLEFKPTQPLLFGKHYTCHVAVGHIYSDAPKKAKNFEFEFNVRELAYEVETDGISYDPENPKRQVIAGRLRVNEVCEAVKIEKMLVAKQGNRALPVTWVHNNDLLSHEWKIKDVERTNVRSRVQLAWFGEAIGVGRQINAEQLVPAAEEFTLLAAKVVQVEEQYVLLNFSDPVAAGQTLDGLIRIEGYSGKLRFVTDGNFVRAYPGERLSGDKVLKIENGIRNAAGQSMKDRSEWKLSFEELKPGVRLVGRGAIIPQQSNGGVIFPFEAVGLKAVDVEIFKIFNSNILQYLQVNEIEGEQELERVGKIVLQKKVDLSELNPNASAKNWQRYALDLKNMIQQDPGAIYAVRLAFRRGYTDCPGAQEELTSVGQYNDNGNLVSIFGGWRGVYWDSNGEEDGWWESNDYNWENREDPCQKEYYFRDNFAQRNVFVSDLGLTAKRGRDGSLFLALTDLHTAQPVPGIDIEFFSYQLQSIGKTKTGADGTVMTENLRETPFVAVATGNGRRGYLRMHDGSTLSLSRFDVAGAETQKGLKGYIYGERGVWRPGDSLYLNFVLEDRAGKLPAGHPVAMELTDPRGTVQHRMIVTQGVGGVWPLHCATRPDAPTGNWQCKVQVGGATFTKQLKIETVKPNRLKLALDFSRKFFSATDANVNGKLAVTWLHGAVARDLKAKVEMVLRATKTEFPNFKSYTFDDPARSFYSEPQTLFDAQIDGFGQATVPMKMNENENAAPGKLIANFKVRAFERGGDFSTDNFAMDVYPYDRFVGVNIPSDSRWGGKTIDDRGTVVAFAMVDKNGKPLVGQQINVGLYRCDWRWWWDEDQQSSIAQFSSAEFVNAVESSTVTTNASGIATWKVRPSEWGRYFVRAVDPEGGHAAGEFCWKGYPENLNDMQSRNAAAMLSFSADKEKYNVGDEVTLKVPASEAGRILLTLETGNRVAKHLWFDAKSGDNLLKFKTEENMAPTVYAHVSMIQPHAQTKNDLPIRMYGVLPVTVENTSTRLTPQIDMPDAVRPDETFNMSLREAGGRACTYTLAVVDEGLLDLTRFQTPNPWDAFYAREALGVKTWDIYDYVLGAYGAQLERILAIGGDGINQKAKNASQVNRFKPTVIHLGPFKLEKGQTARHKLNIQNYVGSVRVMAVMSAPAAKANSGGAYGSAEKTCAVRKPLMLLPTLPRVLGPGETLKLPVDVFAMEKQVTNAVVSVREKTGLVTVGGTGKNTLNFSQPGEQMTYFELKVGQRTGAAKFIITAEGAGEKATQEVEILVRNPNPIMTFVKEGVIDAGQEWSTNYDANLYSDITDASIEVSALPPFNLGRHLSYLIHYPHGCLEQTTSAAFPQLFVDLIAPLTDKQKKDVEKNITAAIGKMRRFQNSNGGLSYWPGGGYTNDWASNYAGHFLIEAKNKGYALPEGLLERWVEYQTSMSRQWSDKATDYYNDDLTQAYRLYTLALAGKPDMAGMNRLREKKTIYSSAAGMLANAYAAAGKPETARELINGKWREDWRYEYCGYTYGSDLRDRALLLETYTAAGDIPRAQAMATYVTTQMNQENGWYWNTQGLATALRALAHYVQKTGGGTGPAYTYQLGNNGMQSGDNSRPVSLMHFTEDVQKQSKVTVKNNGAARLYTRLILAAQPLSGETVATSNNLSMAIRYLNADGQPIDPGRMAQGTDFMAEVTLKRIPGLNFQFENLALSQVFPSGWEIMNDRMNNIPVQGSGPMDYQDVRDDRVLTYFGIPNNKEERKYLVRLNAAYAGRYYLPATSCEAMYDNRIRANAPGKWVEVM